MSEVDAGSGIDVTRTPNEELARRLSFLCARFDAAIARVPVLDQEYNPSTDSCQSTSSRQEHVTALVATGSDNGPERIVHDGRDTAIFPHPGSRSRGNQPASIPELWVRWRSDRRPIA
jgi:hypothetical protein